MYSRFSAAEQAEVWDRYEAGMEMKVIARVIGRSGNAVRDMIRKTGGCVRWRRRCGRNAGCVSKNARRSRGAWQPASRAGWSQPGWAGRRRRSPGR